MLVGDAGRDTALLFSNGKGGKITDWTVRRGGAGPGVGGSGGTRQRSGHCPGRQCMARRLSNSSGSSSSSSSSSSPAASVLPRLARARPCALRPCQPAPVPPRPTRAQVPCEAGRKRCPSLFLASHGYQCTTSTGQSCCKQGDGKQCTLAAAWAGVPTPKTWRGRNLTGSGANAPKPGNATAPTKPGNATAPTKPPATPVGVRVLTPKELLAYKLTETQPPAGGVIRLPAVVRQTTKAATSAAAAKASSAKAGNTTDAASEGVAAGGASAGSTQGQEQQPEQQPEQQAEPQQQEPVKEKPQEQQQQQQQQQEQQEQRGQQTGEQRAAGGKDKRRKKRRDQKKWRDSKKERPSSEDEAASEGSGRRDSKKGGSRDRGGSEEEGAGGEQVGGKWRKATVTYYHSYPPCCHDEAADRTECDDFSGCMWEGQVGGVRPLLGRGRESGGQAQGGRRAAASRSHARLRSGSTAPLALRPHHPPRLLQFAGLGRKPESWVKKNDIVAVFESPNSRNREERWGWLGWLGAWACGEGGPGVAAPRAPPLAGGTAMQWEPVVQGQPQRQPPARLPLAPHTLALARAPRPGLRRSGPASGAARSCG